MKFFLWRAKRTLDAGMHRGWAAWHSASAGSTRYRSAARQGRGDDIDKLFGGAVGPAQRRGKAAV
ncbi:MAG: hypothetical protein WCY82_08370 [Desulfotomaculaceae bacterium]